MERVYQRRLGEGGRKEKDEGGGCSHENGEKRRGEKEKEREKLQHFKRLSLSLSPHLCSSIVQAECPPPQPLTPLRSEAPPLLHSSNTPSLHLPTPTSQICALPPRSPLLSHTPSLSIALQKSGGKMKLYKEGGKKEKKKKSITQMDSWITGSGMLRR